MNISGTQKFQVCETTQTVPSDCALHFPILGVGDCSGFSDEDGHDDELTMNKNYIDIILGFF